MEVPLSSRDFRWFELAYKLSTLSYHENQKMAAIVVSSGRVIAQSCNGRQCGQHAEILTIAKASEVAGATIYIARNSKRVSRPCRHCFKLIRRLGLAKMVFIDENGQLVKRKVRYENETAYKSQNYRWANQIPNWAIYA